MAWQLRPVRVAWSRKRTVPARLSDDEIAAADCLLRMGAHVRAGGRFYDLAQGAQDWYLTLLIETAGQGRLTQTAAKP